MGESPGEANRGQPRAGGSRRSARLDPGGTPRHLLPDGFDALILAHETEVVHWRSVAKPCSRRTSPTETPLPPRHGRSAAATYHGAATDGAQAWRYADGRLDLDGPAGRRSCGIVMEVWIRPWMRTTSWSACARTAAHSRTSSSQQGTPVKKKGSLQLDGRQLAWITLTTRTCPGTALNCGLAGLPFGTVSCAWRTHGEWPAGRTNGAG